MRGHREGRLRRISSGFGVGTRLMGPAVLQRLAVLAAAAAVALAASGAGAATPSYTALFDSDNNAATGCSVATVDGTASGIERIVTVTLTTGGGAASVSGVTTAACAGGTMSAPTTISAGGWPAGLGHGMGGSAAIELSAARDLFPADATLRVVVISDDGTGGRDATAPFIVSLADAAPPLLPSVPVPLAPWLVVPLALSIGFGLAWLRRRQPHALRVFVLVAVLVASGLAWAASVLLDGEVGDWARVPSSVQDPVGDAPGDADIVAAYAQHDGANLYLRIDARVSSGAANTSPVVSAGADVSVTLPAVANLAGAASDDGLPNPPGSLTLAWSKVSGPGTVAFGSAGNATTTASFSAAGTYVLRLSAYDGELTSTDDVTVTVSAGGGGTNAAPVVNAGSAQAITLPATALLAGTASDDGLPNPPAALTLHWSLVSGPGGAVAFGNDAAATTTASFGAPGSYVLRLAASDGELSASSDVTITVQSGAPAIEPVADRIVSPGDHVQVPLVASDYGVPGGLTYALPAAPSGASLAPPPVIDWTPTAAQLGTHTFTATVTNAAAQSASVTFHVTVVAPANHAPKLAPQANQSIYAGAPFARTLTATDPDGDTLHFSLTARPAGMVLAGAAIGWPTGSVAPGDYSVTARVTDTGGLYDEATFTLTVRASALPSAADDAYGVSTGGTLTVPAPGVLGNDSSAVGAALSAARLTGPDKGTLTAFNADGSFTYVAPSDVTPDVSLATTALAGGNVPDSTGYAWAADLNHDGAADVITLSFGTPVAIDGKTGARLWSGWDTSAGSLGQGCLMYLFGTDFAMGDVDDSGEITSIAGTNCDATYSAGVSTRLIAIDTNPAHAVGGAAKVKWVSDRLDAKLPMTSPVDGTTIMDYAVDSRGGGLATSAVPTLARLAPGESVKVLTRILIGTGLYPYDRDGDGTRETVAGCAAATGNEADIGKTCSATLIVDAATGVKEAVLTTPNPDNQYSTPNWAPFRQLPPVVADLDGDGQVEIVSGGDVFKLVGGQWTLAWQWQRLPGSLTWFEPNSVLVADLDGDGKAEVVFQAEWDPDYTGRRRGFVIYNADGTLKNAFVVPTWDLALPIIEDVDGDGVPEIVFSARGIIYAYHGDGSLLWAAVMPDDDGTQPGDATEVHYWPQPVGDRTRAGNGIQVYDLQLDGAKEVIANGNFRIAIIDGRTGAVKWSVHHGGYYANNGVPMIVDADGDGHAEIFSAAAGGGICQYCATLDTVPFAGEHRDWAPAPLIFNQASYNPWAIDDAGVIAYDGAVHRSFRSQRQMGTVVDSRLASTATFTYAASDSSGTSAPATVSISIEPTNHAPVITSRPPTAIPYVFIPGSCETTGCAVSNVIYRMAAYDPDAGDTVHYELVQPTPTPANYPFPNIDPATGLVTMSFVQCGFYGEPCGNLFIVAAVDNHGARTEQSFIVDISSAFRTVPNVVGMSDDDAEAALEAVDLIPRVTEVYSASPAGIVVSQSPAAGAPNITRSATVDIAVSKGPAPVKMPYVVGQQIAPAAALLGSLGIDFAVTPVASGSIPAGEVMTQDPAFGTLIAPAVDGPASLEVSIGPPLAKPIASIVVEPGESTRLVNQKLAYKATAVFTDGTSADITLRAAWTSSPSTVASVDVTGVARGLLAGDTMVAATLSGKSGSSPLHIKSRVAEGTAPIAAITTPADDSTVYGPVDVIGTASDTNFLRYELAYSAADGEDWILLKEGSAAVVDGVLGRFDPTVLLNDLYTLRLRVYDRGDNMTEASATVQVAGNRKVGLFSITLKDLEVPLAGVPLAVTRTYDSRDKRKGDFGVGWRLGMQTLTVRTNRVPGTGWLRSVSGPTVSLAPTSPHKVSVTMADGHVEEFDMKVSPTSNIGSLDATNVAGYTPRPGTLGMLDVIGNKGLLIVSGGSVDELVDDETLETYEPDLYRYTAPSGVAFDISPVDGVRKVRDLNGNEVVFSRDGVSSNAGKSISFTRDADDRIVAATDPAGRVQTYSYDGNGDLVSSTDATGAVMRYTYDRAHGLLEMIDPTGRSMTRTEYDEAGHVVAMVDALGRRIEIAHDDDAQEDAVTDRRGNITRLRYDERGNVVSVKRLVTIEGVPTAVEESTTYDALDNATSTTDPDGRSIAAAFDGARPIARVVDPGNLALATSYGYAGTDDMVSAVDAGGRQYSFSYDASRNAIGTSTPDRGATATERAANGLPARNTDALGTSTLYTYDAQGNVAREEVRDSADRLLSRNDFAYDAAGRVIERTSYRTTGGALKGETTRFTYDPAGRLLAQTDPLGGVSRSEYDAMGLVSASVDPLGRRTRFTYDEVGRRTRTTYDDGSFEAFAYDANGNLLTETDAAGRVTSHAYDELDREVSTTDPAGNTRSTVFSAGGQRLAEIDALGNRTDFDYDSAGRLVGSRLPAVVDAISGTSRRPTIAYQLDALGVPVTVTDAKGHATHYEYDGNGRLLRTTFADGRSTTQTWDALGRKATATNEEGEVVSYGYDGKGRLVSVAGLGGTATYAYDEADNLVAATDALGRTTRYEFDALRRTTGKTYPGGGVERWSYDLAGNVSSFTDSAGRTTSFTYDARDRVTRKLGPDGNAVTWSYDGSGRMLTMTDARGTTTYAYDALGMLSSARSPDGIEVRGQRNAAGQLKELVAPSSTTRYAYDALGFLQSVTAPEGVTTFGRDLAGNRVSVALPNGSVASLDYDERNRATSVAWRKGPAGPVLRSFATDYSPSGRRSRIAEDDGAVTQFAYDANGRLVGEARSGPGAYTHSFAYDAVGNRTSMNAGGQVTNYAYDADDRLTSAGSTSYSWDAAGNLRAVTASSGTRAFGYDGDARMVMATSPSGTVQYSYDGNGVRIGRSTSMGAERLVVDAMNPTGIAQVLERRTTGGLVDRFTFGESALSKTLGGVSQHYLQDARGSVVATTDGTGSVANRYRYDAWGVATDASEVASNPLRYQGEWFDEDSGAYALRARDYDPATGRFLSRDPLGGRTAQPMSRHRYLYANADPVNNRDPLGLETLAELSFVQALNAQLENASILADIKAACQAAGTAESVAEFVSLSQTVAVLAGFGITTAVLAQQVINKVPVVADVGYDSGTLSSRGNLKKWSLVARASGGQFGVSSTFELRAGPAIKLGALIYPPPVKPTGAMAFKKEWPIEEWTTCGVKLGKAVAKVEGNVGAGAEIGAGKADAYVGFGVGASIEVGVLKGAMKFSFPILSYAQKGFTSKVTFLGFEFPLLSSKDIPQAP